jgi:hypothetical protein
MKDIFNMIEFNADKYTWVMRITQEGKIEFNRASNWNKHRKEDNSKYIF